jgi:hypothetical protein
MVPAITPARLAERSRTCSQAVLKEARHDILQLVFCSPSVGTRTEGKWENFTSDARFPLAVSSCGIVAARMGLASSMARRLDRRRVFIFLSKRIEDPGEQN